MRFTLNKIHKKKQIEIKDEDCKGTDAYYNKNIQKLLQSEYVVFLTYKFVKYKYLRFFSSNNLLKYFNKYNVVYLHYYDKQEILNRIDIFNNDIKLKTDDEKEKLAKENEIKKLKMIYFLEHVIEPNTLYKKISFAQEELFMSFDNYLIKKMEYKLRTFCQIAEKLGAEEIKIKYDSSQDNKSTINVDFSIPGGGSIGGSSSEQHTQNNKVDLMFKYSNYQHNLNLNKYYITELVENENDFFISKEEFHSDIDLKFLIDARCLNLIELYNTKIIINRTNQLEKKLFLKAQSYGLSLGSSSTTNDSVSLNISIKFIDIYKKPDCINGANVFVYKQGFWHLINIIKQETLNINNEYNDEHNTINNNINNNIENDKHEKERKEKEIKIYGKLNNYVEAQLIGLEKRQYNIESIYDKTQNLIKTHNDIIKLNFTKQDEINQLFYNYFNTNLVYNNYKIFRDIIIGCYKNIKHIIFKDEYDNINKLCFISIQYHKILHCNLKIYNKITDYTTRIYNKIIDDTNDFHFILKDTDFERLIRFKIPECEILNLIITNKENIISIITNAFKHSYMIYYGLKLECYDTILNDAETLINNNFDNKFSEIIVKLDEIITNNKHFYKSMKEEEHKMNSKYNYEDINNTNKEFFYNDNDNDNDNDNNFSNNNTHNNKNTNFYTNYLNKNKYINNNNNLKNILSCFKNKDKSIKNKFDLNYKIKRIRATLDFCDDIEIIENGNENETTTENEIENETTTEITTETTIIHNSNELQQIHNELHESVISTTTESQSSDTKSQSSDSKSNTSNIKFKTNIKPKKSKATTILHYVINKIIKYVAVEIITYYDSNYPGYVLNIISNLIIKYFCIKYDKPNILKSDFFKNQKEFQTIEDLSNVIKPIITEQRCRLNYIQNKIFYTWENFQFIINFIEKTYMADPMKMNDTNPSNKRINSQYKNRSKSLSPQSPNKQHKSKKYNYKNNDNNNDNNNDKNNDNNNDNKNDKNNDKNRNSKINRDRSLSPINRRYSLFD